MGMQPITESPSKISSAQFERCPGVSNRKGVIIFGVFGEKLNFVLIRFQPWAESASGGHEQTTHHRSHPTRSRMVGSQQES
jgi:hypothetical protein